MPLFANTVFLRDCVRALLTHEPIKSCWGHLKSCHVQHKGHAALLRGPLRAQPPPTTSLKRRPAPTKHLLTCTVMVWWSEMVFFFFHLSVNKTWVPPVFVGGHYLHRASTVSLFSIVSLWIREGLTKGCALDPLGGNRKWTKSGTPQPVLMCTQYTFSCVVESFFFSFSFGVQSKRKHQKNLFLYSQWWWIMRQVTRRVQTRLLYVWWHFHHLGPFVRMRTNFWHEINVLIFDLRKFSAAEWKRETVHYFHGCLS